jgi:trehalose 2-sulfotransferase
MNLYGPQFSAQLDLPSVAIRRTVLIASTPRCGSHMIGHAMARTGLMGVPYEYLNPANLRQWAQQLGTSDAEATLRALMGRRTTPNGVFGIKAHFDHCRTIGGADRMFRALPHLSVVHIRRADVLRQAISYAVARQTGVWIAGQEATSSEARFDTALIDDCLRDIALQNARWSLAFATAGITPLEVVYEEAERDIAATVAGIGRFTGVISDGVVLEVEAATERQSSHDRTRDWVERYAEAQRRSPSPVRRLRDRLVRAVSDQGAG